MSSLGSSVHQLNLFCPWLMLCGCLPLDGLDRFHPSFKVGKCRLSGSWRTGETKPSVLLWRKHELVRQLASGYACGRPSFPVNYVVCERRQTNTHHMLRACATWKPHPYASSTALSRDQSLSAYKRVHSVIARLGD
ncbi:hypothetical protein BD311DRAFT_372923 [Dichomitus squalens]|uniref:Secreted protein n=1 Tax=Dichomitus squalens TaxID=114155 RepID=A0A4Q9MJ88_9APHY|nr:hypothetical protein BD311DRAFT_372923 [Dichomitus squalens]